MKPADKGKGTQLSGCDEVTPQGLAPAVVQLRMFLLRRIKAACHKRAPDSSGSHDKRSHHTDTLKVPFGIPTDRNRQAPSPSGTRMQVILPALERDIFSGTHMNFGWLCKGPLHKPVVGTRKKDQIWFDSNYIYNWVTPSPPGSSATIILQHFMEVCNPTILNKSFPPCSKPTKCIPSQHQWHIFSIERKRKHSWLWHPFKTSCFLPSLLGW